METDALAGVTAVTAVIAVTADTRAGWRSEPVEGGRVGSRGERTNRGAGSSRQRKGGQGLAR